MMIPTGRTPTTPGEILKEEYLTPLSLTQEQLAKHIGVSRITINKIINAKQGVTPDIALRLATFFNTTPEFWLNLQLVVDLYLAHLRHQDQYNHIKPYS